MEGPTLPIFIPPSGGLSGGKEILRNHPPDRALSRLVRRLSRPGADLGERSISGTLGRTDPIGFVLIAPRQNGLSPRLA